MKIFAMIGMCGLITVCGCFSIARYEANVRPDNVKPSALVTGKYRLDRIVLSGSDFAEQGAISEADYVELRWMWKALEMSQKDEKGKSTLLTFFTAAIKSGVGAQIKEWDDSRAFVGFAKSFAKEQPLFRREIATKLQQYCEADVAKDADLKATSITNMVILYGTAKGLSDMLVHFKEGAAKVTGGNVQMFGYQNGKEMFDGMFKKDYVELSFPGRDKLSNKMYFDAVQNALLRNYPNVFTASQDATPVTVLVSFENKFEDEHSYGGLLCALGFPLAQEVDVTYRVRVVMNSNGQSEEELWNEYANSRLEYPPSVQNGGAVRRREMWTSMFLPFSLIGMPGDSDWPKKRKLFTTGSSLITKSRESYAKEMMAMHLKSAQMWQEAVDRSAQMSHNAVNTYAQTLQEEREKAEELSYTYMDRFVFDPVSDGDIIAALVMRSLNKMADAE